MTGPSEPQSNHPSPDEPKNDLGASGPSDTFAFLNMPEGEPAAANLAAEQQATAKITPGLHEAATVPPQQRPALKPVIPGYELIRELGRGGMGVVYQARQLNLNRLVALKMVLAQGPEAADTLARFHREAEAVAKLHHPNIVQIYHIDSYQGSPYFSLEYVDGGDLAHHLRLRSMPINDAVAMLEAVARAVHAAHEKGVLHRDLKPGNILLTKNLIPKIADFGLARQIEDTNRQTATGMILGTPSYMSPEQAAGKKKELGPGTDIYSLGAIFYEMLTGRPPFEGQSAMDTLLQAMNDPPKPPREINPAVPRDLENICLRCLKKNPADRYPTAKALAEDLNRYLSGKQVYAKTEGIWSTLGPKEQMWLRRGCLTLGGFYLFILTLGQALFGFPLEALFLLIIPAWLIWPKPWTFLAGGLALAAGTFISMQIPDYPLGIGLVTGITRGLLIGGSGWLIARWTRTQPMLPVFGAMVLFALAFPVCVDATRGFIQLPKEPTSGRPDSEKGRPASISNQYLERCELKGKAYQRLLAHFALPGLLDAWSHDFSLIVLGKLTESSHQMLSRWQWFTGPFLQPVKGRSLSFDREQASLDKENVYNWYLFECLGYSACITVILAWTGALLGYTIAERRYRLQPQR